MPIGVIFTTYVYTQVQCLLQDLNSNVATPRSTTPSAFKLQKTTFDADGAFATELEQWIDHMDLELPPLTKFILPVGGYAWCLSFSRSL